LPLDALAVHPKHNLNVTDMQIRGGEVYDHFHALLEISRTKCLVPTYLSALAQITDGHGYGQRNPASAPTPARGF
jgi:hypothetical protein